MAHLSGYKGVVTFTAGDPGWSGSVTDWKLERFNKLLTSTTMADSGIEKRVAGIKDFRATVSFLVPSAIGSTGTDVSGAVTARLYTAGTGDSGTDYFTCTGLVESYTVVSPLDGPITATMVFLGTSDVTLTVS